MNTLVFHIDADKIGPNLAESINAYFGDRRVQITVSANEAPEEDHALPFDDISRIADALDRNEPIDVMAEMKKFMDAK